MHARSPVNGIIFCFIAGLISMVTRKNRKGYKFFTIYTGTGNSPEGRDKSLFLKMSRNALLLIFLCGSRIRIKNMCVSLAATTVTGKYIIRLAPAMAAG